MVLEHDDRGGGGFNASLPGHLYFALSPVRDDDVRRPCSGTSHSREKMLPGPEHLLSPSGGPYLFLTACHTQPASQPRLGQVLFMSLVSTGWQPKKDVGVNKPIWVPRPAAHHALALQTTSGFTGVHAAESGSCPQKHPHACPSARCHHLES